MYEYSAVCSTHGDNDLYVKMWRRKKNGKKEKIIVYHHDVVCQEQLKSLHMQKIIIIC